jgi:serine/threonine-protein kinase
MIAHRATIAPLGVPKKAHIIARRGKHMIDIPEYGTFIKIEPVTKGWSGDKKYYIETADSKRMLLRVSSISELDLKKSEYDMMARVYGLGVLAPEPLSFGLCDDGESCYSLSGWLDGEDAEKALPLMSETAQYVLGLKSGETLRKIHTLSVPVRIAEWKERYSTVIDERIEAYYREGAPFKGKETILDYLKKNRSLLHGRPQCFLHGDFHEGNLMVGSGGELYIIDLLDEGFGNYGDPWYDFKTFGENENAYFSTGFVRGYFNGEPPQIFWDVLTYYIVTAALTSIVWMKYHKPEELPETISWNERNAQALSEGRSPLMKWYLHNFYIQWNDGVPYKLKAPFDFSFLSKYGKVFKVFDNQSSGNICFGVDKAGKRYFLKFAGARTVNDALQNPEDAITRLKHTVPKYKALKHPLLINLIDAEAIGSGYITVFDWFDGESCGYPQPKMCKRFMALPAEEKLRVYKGILEFHAHVAKCGYVAIDFNDHATLYNFDSGDFVICDIDFYAKQCYMNGYSGIWGAPFLMSPEESRSGAVVDEISNVYTMGATAFAFFCDGWDKRDRRKEDWKLNSKLYDVAKRAISDDRNERQQSICQLIEEWMAAE